MPKERFFSPLLFQENTTISLEGQEHHHVSRVMRCKEGDTIELVNGQNELAKGSIVRVEKTKTTLEITSIYKEKKPKSPLILVQALLKFSSLELVIEKGTELGVTKFYLFPAQKSEKTSLSLQQHHRLQALAISALKQCGRLDLPSLECMPPLLQKVQEQNKTSWIKQLAGEGLLLFGDLSLPSSFSSIGKKDTPLALCIGPEGGFSQEELLLLRNVGRGICFNSHILRAETAALCGLSLLAAP